MHHILLTSCYLLLRTVTRIVYNVYNSYDTKNEAKMVDLKTQHYRFDNDSSVYHLDQKVNIFFYAGKLDGRNKQQFINDFELLHGFDKQKLTK